MKEEHTVKAAYKQINNQWIETIFTPNSEQHKIFNKFVEDNNYGSRKTTITEKIEEKIEELKDFILNRGSDSGVSNSLKSSEIKDGKYKSFTVENAGHLTEEQFNFILMNDQIHPSLIFIFDEDTHNLEQRVLGDNLTLNDDVIVTLV